MSSTRHIARRPLLVLLSLALAQCGGDGGGTGPGEPVPTTIQIANASITLTALGETATIAVTVLDQNGSSIPNPPLDFTSEDEAIVTVSQAGVVTAEGEGSTQVVVTSGNVSRDVAVTVDQAVADVTGISGDGQTGDVGSQLPDPLVVRVEDSRGNPIAGESVSFQVESGGGNVSAASVPSDQDGEASVIWTLGNGAGQQSVRAAAGSETVTFTATAEPLPPATIEITGEGQAGAPGFTLLDPLTVLVQDAEGNVVPGTAVTLVASDGGTTTPATFTSEQDPVLVNWTLGGTAAEQTLTVTAGDAEAVVTATATQPAMLTPGIAATDQSGAAGEAVYYAFEIPAAVAPESTAAAQTETVLRVEVNGGAGDRSLHVRMGSPPEGQDGTVVADCSDLAPGLEKVCQISSPAGGTWFAAVIGPSGFTEATVIVSLTTLRPDLVAGDLTVAPSTPNATETVTISGSIGNDGTLASGSFGWSIEVDGEEVATGTVDDLAPGESTPVSAENVGPFAEGQHTATLIVDAAGAVTDPDPDDNVSEIDFAVTAAPPTAIIEAAPTSIPSGDGNQTVVMLYAGNSIDPQDDPLTFSWSAPDGTFEGGVNTGAKVNVTFPGDLAVGSSYTVTLTVHDGQGNQDQEQVQITQAPALPAVGTFDIVVEFIDNAESQPPTAAQQDAFDQAEAKWEQIIRSELTDVNFGSPGFDIEETCTGADPDGDGMPGNGTNDLSGVVDDLKIFVFLEPIDGAGGTLGAAGPCFIRSPTPRGLPIVGTMRFDTDDLAQLEADGLLDPVILHEMAHVLGLGTLWRSPAEDCLNFGFAFLVEPSLSFDGMCQLQNVDPPRDTRYDGARGVEAYRSMGGGRTELVPIENGDGPRGGGPGNRDSHWRDVTFTSELMTAFIGGGGTAPLSKLTIAGLEDLNYRVNYAPADDFTLPDPIVTAPATAATHVLLLDDIRRGPIWIVDENGRIVGRGGNE